MNSNTIKESNQEDIVELKGYIPKISREDAIKIARKKPFFRRERGTINSVMLLYKPFLLLHYNATVKHKKRKSDAAENIELYIAVDMITGLGFESESIEPLTTIRVRRNQVIKPLINRDKALSEAKRLILKLKTRMSKYGLVIINEEFVELGIVYRPIWIIKFVNNDKETYVGVDGLKGVRL